MQHRAHKNNAMIPDIIYRAAMQPHVAKLVLLTTQAVMRWQDSKLTLPRVAYEQLKTRGYQNEEFTDLCQQVVDYCDYLIYGKSQFYVQEAVQEAVTRSLELYLAKYYDRHPHLLKELDVMGRNKTLAHIDDIRLLRPELLKHLQQRNEQMEKLK